MIIYIDADLFHGVKSHIVTCDISDHFLCISTIQDLSLSNSTKKSYVTRKIHETVMYNIKGALGNTNWTFLEELTVNEGTKALSCKIQEALDFYAPLKTVTIPANKNIKIREPWFTEGLNTSSVKCRKMHKKVIRKPHDSPEYVEYKEYRNLYNRLRRKAKHKYYNDIIESHRHNSKKLWSTLNKITGKVSNKKDITDEVIVNGIKETNTKVISNAFAKYYSEVGKNLAEKIEQKGNVLDPTKHISQKVDANCFLFPTTPLEIEKIIKGLKSKKSSGHDNVSNNMLKIIYPSILHALWILFNKSLTTGEFPEDMKLSIVKPIYKAKSRTEISNYRPISLLTVISKILEKIVHIRMTKFLYKNKILYEGQYGFRKQRSTTDAILDLTGNILEGFNKDMYTIALFIDMSKAFDTIKHQTLFNKLEMYGMRGITLNWLKSYLTGRNIKVMINGTLSDCYPADFGTPQGSVLGPLLYIILANDLPKSLKFSNCIMFADDTTIYASGKNPKLIYKKINEDLKKLSQWFDYNSLSLNVDKSYYMVFRCKNRKLDYQEKVIIGGKEVQKVANIKFLGVHLDEHLDWNVHMKHLMSRLTIGIYSLHMVKHMLPLYVKRLLYMSNVESHLNYGMAAWGPMLSACNLKKLKIQQNKAIRALLNIPIRTRITPCYKRARIMNIDDLIELSLVKISHRYIHNKLPQRITNLFENTTHTYETRNRNVLRTPHHTKQIYNKSYLARAPHLWLQLSQNSRDIINIKSFANYFSKTKLQNYL